MNKEIKEIKEIDIKKCFYLCAPLLNKECTKENCYINNGYCCYTVNEKYSQEHLLNYITSLQEENQKLNKIIEDIDKYIHFFKIEDIGEKTMLILNDILLIKNGLGKNVIRLNKLTELKNEVKQNE